MVSNQFIQNCKLKMHTENNEFKCMNIIVYEIKYELEKSIRLSNIRTNESIGEDESGRPRLKVDCPKRKTFFGAVQNIYL